MKSRWIGMVVCLLYLSISTVFAAIHHHDSGSSNDSDQCAACAWHHETHTDVPSVSVPLPRPIIIACREQGANDFLRELSVKIHPSRGPPIISL
jgi:hypothetical protein